MASSLWTAALYCDGYTVPQLVNNHPGYNRGGGIIFRVLIMSVLLVFHSVPLFPQTTCGVTNKVGEAQQRLNNGLMSMKMMWIICDGLLSHHVAPLGDFVTITERSTPPSTPIEGNSFRIMIFIPSVEFQLENLCQVAKCSWGLWLTNTSFHSSRIYIFKYR